MKYRPDIDGLRALAVLMVLGFHAGEVIPGGFVGVDIFFVISGYLITGVIVSELGRGVFSYKGFWARRVCRLLPAAFVMVVCVLVAGYFLLLPQYLRSLGTAAVSQSIMAANVWAWRSTSYFSLSSEYHPLLHTWSLAVEEQFYLVFPFLVAFLLRLGRQKCAIALLALALVSFAWSVYGVRFYPSATFYLLPTRAWELLLGATLFFLPNPERLRAPRIIVELASLSGLVGIALAMVAFDGHMVFPGESALLPCVSAATLLWAGGSGKIMSDRLLSCRPLVFVGLVSYSLYLWHWPLLSLAAALSRQPLPLLGQAALLLVSFGLAVLSWAFIEKPFRGRAGEWGPTRCYAVGGGAMALVAVLGLGTRAGDGHSYRFDPVVDELLSFQGSMDCIAELSPEDVREGRLPELGVEGRPPSFLLWGDSHAMAIAPALSKAALQCGLSGWQATHSSTPPVLGFVFSSRHGLNAAAPAWNELVLSRLDSSSVEVVFLAALWSSYAGDPEFAVALRSTVSALTERGLRVFLVMDVPGHSVDPPRYFALGAAYGWEDSYRGIDQESYLLSNRQSLRLFDGLSLGADLVSVLRPELEFLGPNGLYAVRDEGGLYYRDKAHLSVYGAEHLVSFFADVLKLLKP